MTVSDWAYIVPVVTPHLVADTRWQRDALSQLRDQHASLAVLCRWVQAVMELSPKSLQVHADRRRN